MNNKFKNKWYNKLGMYKIYDSKCEKETYKWCFIKVKSHDEESFPNNNILSIGFGTRYRSWVLPFQIVKPVFDFYTYNYEKEGMTSQEYYRGGKEKLVKHGVKPSGSIYGESEWEIALVSPFDDKFSVFQLKAAVVEQLNTRSDYKPLLDIYWTFPWESSMRTVEKLLDTDGALFYDASSEEYWFKKTKNKDFLEEVLPKKEEQPYEKFEFIDCDGENVIATCTRSYSEYSLGTTHFYRKLFKLFGVKPEKHWYLDLEFSTDIGPEKESSWKGGVVGTSYEISPFDTMQGAFKRFCIDSYGKLGKDIKNLKFVGKYEDREK